VAVALAGPYAKYLHLTLDRYPYQHLISKFFAGWILFLMPNQQCQSTEGRVTSVKKFQNDSKERVAAPDSIHFPSVRQGKSDHNAELSTLIHAQSTENQGHTAPVNSLSLHLQYEQLTARGTPALHTRKLA